MKPITLQEWDLYVRELTPEDLWNKSRSMNTINFVRQLESEGYKADHIHKIFAVFSRRFSELDLEPPTGGYVDLREILN